MPRSLSALVLLVVVTALGVTRHDVSAIPMSFGTGSLIIPMDTGSSGQDNGMLRAYGLVYELLRHGVPVYWAIDPAKAANGDDFSVSVSSALQDVRTGATLPPRSYRGGPFLIDTADAADALPVIQAWQAAPGDQTSVHRLISATSINPDVARLLVSAPRIAIVKDGNETIAFNDLNAAGIPDALGAAWSASSPDLLSETDIEGATTTADDDGALFDQSSAPSRPRYCFLASMHYNATSHTDEVAQEVRQWLDRSDLVHAYMQCEAARVFENAVGGQYLTYAGLDDDGAATSSPAIRVPSSTLAQLDGTFVVDTGSVDSMHAIASGGPSDYKPGVTTLINDSASTLTQRITMMTGRLDGDPANGRVTYLAGHDYAVDLPITANPQTNGVRLFLNALLTSDCASTHGDDDLVITKSAPAFTTTSDIAYTISVGNPATNTAVAENVEVADALPAGTTYVAGSGTPAPTSIASGVVTWDLPALAPGAQTTVTFHVSVTSDGSYTNSATVSFATTTVGEVTSAPAVTVRDTVPPTVTVIAGPTGTTNTTTPAFKFTMGADAVSAVCAIDNVNFTACSPDPAQYTSAPLTSGPHTFYVRVSDAAGNTATATRSFTIDTDPPIVEFADPPTNSTVTSNPTPRFYFSALGGGVVTTFCSVAGDPFVQCTSPFTTRSLPDGMYTVSVYAIDDAQNTGPTDTFTFTIDHLAPVVSIPVPPNQTVFKTKTPTFTFADVGSPGTAVTFTCRIDAGADAPCSSGFGVPASANLADGAHTLTVTATDQAGNSGQASLGFTVDTVPPIVDIPGPPTNPTTVSTGTPTFFFQLSNVPNTTPIVSSVCRIYDAAPPNALRAQSLPNTICDTLFTVSLASALSDGAYLFEVTATDGAGNVGTALHAFSFTVDTSAPVVTIIVPPSPTDTNDPNPTFTFSVDPGGTPVATACRVYVPFTSPPPAQPCSSPYTVPTALADGGYLFEVIGTDAADNVGSTSLLFHVDRQPPDTNITRLGPTPSGAQVDFVLTSDESATFECALDGAPFTPCPPSFTTPVLSDGEHQLLARAIDAAGNADPSPAAHVWTVDTTTRTTSLCGAGPFICKTAGLTQLTIRNAADDSRDKLKFTWTRGEETSASDVGDPTVDTQYAVCVWDRVGGTAQLVMEMSAPPAGNCGGHPCWRAIGSGGFRYHDAGLLPNGIQQLNVFTGALGKAKVSVTARGVAMPDPPMPFQHDPTITVQVVNSIGSCWGADYVSAPRTNTDAKLVAKEKP